MVLRLTNIPLRYLLLLAALIRVAFILFSGKTAEAAYWEYGQLAQQLLAGNGYSFPFTNAQLEFLPDQFYPSALMPPGYVFFLLPFMMIPDVFFRNLLLFSTQAALSVLAIFLVYRWSEKRFEKPVAVVILLLQAVYPEMIYACCTVGPTIWFHLLMAGILFHLPEKRQAVFVGILAGLLVLMRSEALLPAGLLLMVEFFRGHKKASLISGMAMLLCLSPWLIRNQVMFGKPMLSANLGVNFYRGNNSEAIGNWPVWERDVEAQLRAQPSAFEQKNDEMALSAALRWVAEHPAAFLSRMPEKFIRFWLLDWHDSRTRHWLYVLPWLLCIPLGIGGLAVKAFFGRQELLILFISYSLIVLVFFPQARYLTLVKFFWLIPAGAGLCNLWMMAYPKNKFLSSGQGE